MKRTLLLAVLCFPVANGKEDPVLLSDDGGWCWYQDERAVIVGEHLVVGTIAMGVHEADRKGDAEVLVFDLRKRSVERRQLHDQLGADDHNVAAFVPRPDGRLLGVFATHGRANSFWYRVSEPNDPLEWSEVRSFVPTPKSRITYSNPFCLPGEKNRITSDGTSIAPLGQGLAKPEVGTRVYQGGVTHVAWTQDLHLDAKNRPVAVFSVQRDPSNLPPGHPESGRDHRYHYARWDGGQWRQHEIAYAGTRLYPKEDDYTGLIVIDPDDVNAVYLSTDADPVNGMPLISKADGRRHYEIYRGVTKDGGATFRWSALTSDSRADNIRPIVPKWDRDHTAVLWLRGKMTTFTDYDLEVVGLIDPL